MQPSLVMSNPRSPWLIALFVCGTLGCSGDDDSGHRDGGEDPAGDGDGEPGGLGSSPLCSEAYPAQACDGDPHGEWKLVASCASSFADCPGARVTRTGTAEATLRFAEGSPEGQYEYEYDFDTETRLSVPASCLDGASCESIGCFAGDDPCSCVLGSGRGGSRSGPWEQRVSGEVAILDPNDPESNIRFCAGETRADSMMGDMRVVWERVCTEEMDCRPSDPCHFGKAACSEDAVRCEDTGDNRPVGTVCGDDRVCDADGACVTCVAGADCTMEDRPCQLATISCSTAEPVCRIEGDREDGSACGNGGQCERGECKLPDGARCTSDAECDDSCTCGDAQCTERYCGRFCACQYAMPGGDCVGALDEGVLDPIMCDKACFEGRCAAAVGDQCNTDGDCGSDHCTCWLPNCSGGRLCSTVACPCQWASSGAEECGGPLSDGLGDLSCLAPQSCIEGSCQ